MVSHMPEAKPSIWIRLAISAAIAIPHFCGSWMLLNYAYVRGDASSPVPLPVKLAMCVFGFPLVWPAYAMRLFAGQWTEAAVYLLIGLTPINSLFCSWLLMRVFTRRPLRATRTI
jgi:hypothetical protein